MIFEVDVIMKENQILQNKKWLGKKTSSPTQASGIKNVPKWKIIYTFLLFLQDGIWKAIPCRMQSHMKALDKKL